MSINTQCSQSVVNSCDGAMVSLCAVQQRPLWLKMVYIENTLFFSNWKRKFFHQPCLIFLQGLFCVEFGRVIPTGKNRITHSISVVSFTIISSHFISLCLLCSFLSNQIIIPKHPRTPLKLWNVFTVIENKAGQDICTRYSVQHREVNSRPGILRNL